MISVFVTLRRNDTGDEITYSMQVPAEDDGTPRTYAFEDGNWSCDCNRYLDWERHGGDMAGLPEDDEHTCMGGWDGGGLFSLKAMHSGKAVFADGAFAMKETT